MPHNAQQISPTGQRDIGRGSLRPHSSLGPLARLRDDGSKAHSPTYEKTERQRGVDTHQGILVFIPSNPPVRQA